VFEKGDIIVDTGNALFRDQTRRAEELEAKGLRFLGMGISGGEEGAQKGPAFLPGGTLSVWNDIKYVIEPVSAKAMDGRPCATMNGKGGAGSCVKMYHNAGEYAILRIWSEVSAVMKSWGISGERQAKILTSWKSKNVPNHPNFLNSYMLDITIEVARAKDTEVGDGSMLATKVMDVIGSKGTGVWSVQEALGAGCPAGSLAEAVQARQMSMYRDERLKNVDRLPIPEQTTSHTQEMIEDLYWATGLSVIASYAQMFQCLRALDQQFHFGLNFPATIATFRAGCILQGYLLQPMTKAFENDPNISNLLVAFAPEIKHNMFRFKRMIGNLMTNTNTAAPCMTVLICYIETMTMRSLSSAQCTALQRDVFGRHGFKRSDMDGDFNHQCCEG
jgi:6-phosphogluconate dehydrogenase